MPEFAALIVAGGSGSRLGGDLPKQYQPLGGVAIIRRTADAFHRHPDIAHVQIVIGEGHLNHFQHALGSMGFSSPVLGGATRQQSVRHGLESLAQHNPGAVLIHDAARPLVSTEIIDAVINALQSGADAVAPLVPVSDSLKRRDMAGVLRSVSRDNLYRAQTPQGFRFTAILDAHAKFANEAVTDDIALAELAGLKVVPVPGEEANIKITTAADLKLAERLLGRNTDIRTGFGFDVHRFVPGDHVWLCGVRIPHEQGLEGHSDADAGLHALTDAILGALSAGDIGLHFPPSDEKWRNAQSRAFLEHAADLLRKAGGTIVNCDVTLICEQPRIGPHRTAMQSIVAEILGIQVARVSVKATTTEGLGFTGRREGLAAHAVASIRLPSP